MRNKISVVIPNFNDFRIERTLKSITNQTYTDYEIIIVEGCLNNTKTNAIYEKYLSKIKHLIHEPDKGIFDALNKGINLAKGHYIILIGSDDRLSDKNIFSEVINIINKDNSITGVCLECHFVNSKDKLIRKWLPKKITKQKIKWGILPPHFSLFLNRSVYEKLGLFDLKSGNIGLDSKWLLNLINIENLNIRILKNYSVIMELGGTSTGSLKNILIAYKNIALEAKQLGFSNWFILPLIKILSKTNQFLLIQQRKE